MTEVFDLPKRIDVRWDSRLIIISDRIPLHSVHQSIKMSFFYRSKFKVPVLNHSSHVFDISAGAPELKRLVLDQGWNIIGDHHVYNAKMSKTTFTGRDGEKVTQVVLEPYSPSKLNLIA